MGNVIDKIMEAEDCWPSFCLRGSLFPRVLWARKPCMPLALQLYVMGRGKRDEAVTGAGICRYLLVMSRKDGGHLSPARPEELIRGY